MRQTSHIQQEHWTPPNPYTELPFAFEIWSFELAFIAVGGGRCVVRSMKVILAMLVLAVVVTACVHRIGLAKQLSDSAYSQRIVGTWNLDKTVFTSSFSKDSNTWQTTHCSCLLKLERDGKYEATAQVVLPSETRKSNTQGLWWIEGGAFFRIPVSNGVPIIVESKGEMMVITKRGFKFPMNSVQHIIRLETNEMELSLGIDVAGSETWKRQDVTRLLQ